jgi:hypothetical protein
MNDDRHRAHARGAQAIAEMRILLMVCRIGNQCPILEGGAVHPALLASGTHAPSATAIRTPNWRRHAVPCPSLSARALRSWQRGGRFGRCESGPSHRPFRAGPTPWPATATSCPAASTTPKHGLKEAAAQSVGGVPAGVTLTIGDADGRSIGSRKRREYRLWEPLSRFVTALARWVGLPASAAVQEPSTSHVGR